MKIFFSFLLLGFLTSCSSIAKYDRTEVFEKFSKEFPHKIQFDDLEPVERRL